MDAQIQLYTIYTDLQGSEQTQSIISSKDFTQQRDRGSSISSKGGP